MRHCLIALLLPIVIATSAICDPATPVPRGSSIQAVADRYDFGARSELETAPITHTFVLNALGKTPVTVDRLQPSCHCTHAVADRETDSYGRFAIPPGQSVDVVATIDPSDIVPGDIEKDIYVFVNGESTPAVTLHLGGRITPEVSFSPLVLDFGKIADRAGSVKIITVTIDKRLLPRGKSAVLTCPNPAISVVKSGDPISVAGGYLRQAYKVAVSATATPGMFKSALLLQLPDADVSQKPAWSISVVGNIAAER